MDICLGLLKDFCLLYPEKLWLVPTIQMEISYVTDARHPAIIPSNQGKLYPTISLESFQCAKILNMNMAHHNVVEYESAFAVYARRDKQKS